MSDGKHSEIARSWDTYWQGTGDVGAFSAGGVAHPAIAAFWDSFFSSIASNGQPTKLLDVATGNGAILASALSVLNAEMTSITCVDISAAAIKNVEQQFPGTVGIVADARSIPLDDKQFSLVTSQFGVEYAGLDAVQESARMIADGGKLALMLHIVDGLVHQECSASLAAIQKLRASNFVPLSIELFRTGFAAVRGADRSAYDAAGAQLAPAIQIAEAIMAEYGEGVAGDTIARLYSDVGRIHGEINKYDPDEIFNWLDTMDRELDAYAGRMSSMMDAAVDDQAFRDLCVKLESSGFKLDRSEPLLPPEQTIPIAWVLVATR
ncbi:MAG: class I SAM-dependent methyltransferase [Proteobacteria bacterium]|nr:class I SAM-dependent methyltransferase [Pseudomonadota bacterium]